MDLCKRSFSNFSFPVEQVQTVYRLLVRAEPGLLERLSMSITEVEGVATEEKGDDDGFVVNWNNKRKDDTSKVLVYNSYIYPTLGKKYKYNFELLSEGFFQRK